MLLLNREFREKIAKCKEMGRKWAEDNFVRIESEDEVLLNREAVYDFCKERYGFTKEETDYFLVPYVKAMQKRFPNKFRYYRDMYKREQASACIREALKEDGKQFTHSEYGMTIRNLRSIIENDYENYDKKLLKRMGFTKEEMLAEHYDAYSFNKMKTNDECDELTGEKNTPETMSRYYTRRRNLSEKEFVLAYDAKERYYNALETRANAFGVQQEVQEALNKVNAYKEQLEKERDNTQ